MEIKETGKKMQKIMTQNEVVPLELLEEILARLPAKTLLRLRCVCQSFISLIDSPDFISKHRNLFKNNKEKTNILFVRNNYYIPHKHAFLVHRSDTFELAQVLNFSLPIKDKFSIEGYIDGLLLIQKQKSYTGNYWRLNGLILCNPSIRKSRRLPPPAYSHLSISTVFHIGFGFDSSINDHKVVIVQYPYPPVRHMEGACLSVCVEIFSLKANIWKSIWDKTSCLICSGGKAFVNGAIHWLGEDRLASPQVIKGKGSHIVSFDVSNETFRYTELPDIDQRGDLEHEGYSSFVIDLCGSLGLVDCFKTETCIWTMKRDSWTKHCTIDLEKVDNIYAIDDGRLLLSQLRIKLLKWYDLKSGQIIPVHTQEHACLEEFADVYVESLFWSKRDDAPPIVIPSLNGIKRKPRVKHRGYYRRIMVRRNASNSRQQT